MRGHALCMVKWPGCQVVRPIWIQTTSFTRSDRASRDRTPRPPGLALRSWSACPTRPVRAALRRCGAPISSTVAPSRIGPQSMSMSSLHAAGRVAELEASLSEGVGPEAEHRAAAGGEGHQVGAARHDAGDRDRVVAGRVHEDEAALRVGRSAHVDLRRRSGWPAPAARLRRAIFPSTVGDAAGDGFLGEGLRSTSAPCDCRCARHQAIRSSSFSATAGSEARRVSSCSAPVDLGRLAEDRRAAIADELKSTARPSAGFAVIPLSSHPIRRSWCRA